MIVAIWCELFSLIALLLFSRSLAQIYLMTFLAAVASGCFEPAKSALIPHLVCDEELTAANPLASFTFQLAKALGPALAGTLVVVVGISATFYLNALSFVFSALALSLIRTDSAPMPCPCGLWASWPTCCLFS